MSRALHTEELGHGNWGERGSAILDPKLTRQQQRDSRIKTRKAMLLRFSEDLMFLFWVSINRWCN